MLVTSFFLKLRFIFHVFPLWNDSKLKLVLKTLLVPLNTLVKETEDKESFLDVGGGLGITTLLLSYVCPKLNVECWDQEAAWTWDALDVAFPNTKFKRADILALAETPEKFDLVYLNDVLHHIPYEKQRKFLETLAGLVTDDGKVILKDVDIDHASDRVFTTFWDQKLYPEDKLCFRSRGDLNKLVNRSKLRMISAKRTLSLWPASQTVIMAEKDEGLSKENTRRHARKWSKVILVTGATGFIGRHLIDVITRDHPNWFIWALCRNASDRAFSSMTNVGVVVGDLLDVDYYSTLLEDADYVFHLAAEVNIQKSNTVNFNNLYSTQTLVDACKRTDKKPLLIFASTAGVLDRPRSDIELKPLDENSPASPLTNYGRTKLSSERYISQTYANHVIARIPWAFGSFMLPKTHVRFICDLALKNPLFRHFLIPAEYNFLDASDACRQMLGLATHGELPHKVFMLGAPTNRPLADVIDQHCSFGGLKSGTLKFPALFIRRLRFLRPWLPFQVQGLFWNLLAVNTTRLHATINQVPTTSLRQQLYKMKFWNVTSNVAKELPCTVITGAASGLGHSLASAYLRNGHTVVGVDINPPNNETQTQHYHAIQTDISSKDTIGNLKTYLESNGLFPEILVNCAGVGFKISSSLEHEDAKTAKEIDINAKALVTLSSLILNADDDPVTQKTIINIGSSAGFQPLPTMATYAASKSFVHSYSLAVQGELLSDCRQRKVALRCVAPSGFKSNFQRAGGVKTGAKEVLDNPEALANKIADLRGFKTGLDTLSFRSSAMAIAAKLLPATLQVKLWTKLMKELR